MAIIIRCRQCRTRIETDAEPCPACGSAVKYFTLDYLQNGRYSRRIRAVLPDTVETLEQAQLVDRMRRTSRTKKTRELPADAATVDYLFPAYLEWYGAHRAATSLADLKLIYNAHISRILGNEKIVGLTTENLDYYQQMRLQEKRKGTTRTVKPRTINKELNYFSGFLKWCRRHKRIDIAPVYYERLKADRPRPEILTIEEVWKIIEAANPFYRAFILCLYALGLRFAEARWLTLRHFDFAAMSVTVRQKGGSQKVLPVDEIVAEAIRALSVTDPDQWLFLNPRTVSEACPRGKPIGDIQKALGRICAAAKVTKRVHPHMFRHSWATHLLGAEVNLRTIQRYLGHAQSATTEFYTHVAIQHLRDASDHVIGRRRVQEKDSAEGEGKADGRPVDGKRGAKGALNVNKISS